MMGLSRSRFGKLVIIAVAVAVAFLNVDVGVYRLSIGFAFFQDTQCINIFYIEVILDQACRNLWY